LQINFKDNAYDETYTHLERKIGTSGSWGPYVYFNALSGANNWNWTDTGLAQNQTYCYRMRAQNSYGYSSYSNEACGMTGGAAVSLPLAPGNVSISNATISSLRVNFKDNATDETNILVERRIGSTGTWAQVANFGALTGSGYWYWNNSGLTTKVTYCYRMRATNGAGSSAYSNIACGNTL